MQPKDGHLLLSTRALLLFCVATGVGTLCGAVLFWREIAYEQVVLVADGSVLCLAKRCALFPGPPLLRLGGSRPEEVPAHFLESCRADLPRASDRRYAAGFREGSEEARRRMAEGAPTLLVPEPVSARPSSSNYDATRGVPLERNPVCGLTPQEYFGRVHGYNRTVLEFVERGAFAGDLRQFSDVILRPTRDAGGLPARELALGSPFRQGSLTARVQERGAKYDFSVSDPAQGTRISDAFAAERARGFRLLFVDAAHRVVILAYQTRSLTVRGAAGSRDYQTRVVDIYRVYAARSGVLLTESIVPTEEVSGLH